MKKKLLVGLVVLTLGLLAVGAAVPALAQSNQKDTAGYSKVYLDRPTLVRLADALGLTPEELSSQLQTGKTLADIAQDKNVATETLIQAIIAPYADQLALQARYGYLTQEQTDALLEAARERASFVLEQNLSATSGLNNGYSGYCGDMMANYGGSAGYGGMMSGWGGHGMMGGWGYYGDSGSTQSPDYSPNRGPVRGGGMMGGGMMGAW